MLNSNEELDLLIQNAKVPFSNKIMEINIGIKNEKINSLSNKTKDSKKTIDASNKLVIPGAIDPHAHIYDPEYEYRETFQTGTKAAAAGGVTTFFDMPLTTPVISEEQIKNKIKKGEKESLIDFSIHSGMFTDQYQRISKIKELGINSFKSFTCPPYQVNTDQIYKIGKKIKKQNGVYILHSEDGNLIKHFEQNKSPEIMARNKSRPSFIEEIAIDKVGKIARETGFKYHIAHLSSKKGVKALKNLKKESKITAETTPQFLTFTREDVKKEGPYLTMNPPIKSKEDQKTLWKALRNGTIDMIGTDHAPGTKQEKEVGWKDIWEAWGGLPGIQEMLPIMLNGVNNGKLTIEDLIRTTSKNAAKLFGLYPQKGSLLPGTDADLTIVDMDQKYKIKNEDTYYKVGWTPYDGIKLQGKIKTTIIRGKIVYEEQNGIKASKEHGKFLNYKYGNQKTNKTT